MNNNKKICLVTGQYPPTIGGVGHSAHRLVTMLGRHGYSMHVVVFTKTPFRTPFDEAIKTTQEDNAWVHRVQIWHNKDTSETASLTRSNREMFDALDAIHSLHQFDILHGFFLFPAAYIAGMVARKHGIPDVASIRGNDVGKYIFDPLRLGFIRSALENATFVTSVATSLATVADRSVVSLQGKWRTILNSLRRIDPSPAPPVDLNLRGVVIGTCGLFRYKKGIVYLMKALQSLRKEIDFTLLLVGDDFDHEGGKAHREDLARYDLLDKVVTTGKRPPDEMPGYINLFDILVFPSLFSEGCPLSMLEAMAGGKPIVASRAGAIPEIIEHEVNGLLVQPGSSDEIATSILRLIQNPALREKISMNAQKTVLGMTPERELSEWVDVYDTAFARHGMKTESSMGAEIGSR